MKKILISLYLVLVCFLSFSQTYNPSLGTTSNKAYAPSQATPTDFRTYYYDLVNFVLRPYQNTTEVLNYLNLPTYRTGQFPIVVNIGGIISGGVITGGVNSLYYFKDGVADSNLVLMFPTPGACAGCLININNLSDVSNPATARTNLGLQNMAQQTTAAGGDLSGFWPAPTVAKFAGQLPSFYLNYLNLINTPIIPAQFNLIAGTNVSTSGAYPNITVNANNNAAGATAGYGINATLLAAGIVAIDSLHFRKQDTSFVKNDSTVIITINGRADTLIIRGGVHGSGSGAGTVTNFSFTNANGVSGSVANPTSTPNLTITLGAITPTSVNALTLLALTNGFSITGGTTPAVLTVPSNATVSGTNTGDVTLTGETYLTISGQQINAHPIDVSGTNITGILKTASFPGISGDVVISAGTTTSTIQPNVVTFAKLQTLPAGSFFGNPTLSLGNSKAVYAKYGLLFDADSLKVDTTLLKTIFGNGGVTPLADTLFVVNLPSGGLGFPISRVSSDTAYLPKLFCVGCVLDSTTNPGGLTINQIGAVTLNNGLTLSGINGQLGGLLTQNTTITGGSHNVKITGSNVVVLTTVDTASNGDIAIFTGSNGQIPVEFIKRSANDTSVDVIAEIVKGNLTGTVRNKSGSILYWGLQNSSGSSTQAATQSVLITDSATATYTTEFHINLRNNGPAPATDQFILNGNGSLRLSNYGVGSFTGTATKNLAVDASGNIIEVVTGGGGSGGAINDSTTSGSNTTLSLPAGNALYMIIVNPASNTTSFNVGTTSGAGDIVPTQSITGGVNAIFTPNYYTTGGVTLFFTGITSSTFIKIKKL